jgi:multiple sugar transport system permease protein
MQDSRLRTAFYLPQITPAVTAGVLWLRILSPQNGLLNQALAVIGINGPDWTIDAQSVKPALVIMKSWSLGWMVVIYLAALQQVPKELYEAAVVDGANALQRFWHVTLPMISSVLFFTLVMLTIFSLNIFTEPMVMFPPQVFGG